MFLFLSRSRPRLCHPRKGDFIPGSIHYINKFNFDTKLFNSCRRAHLYNNMATIFGINLPDISLKIFLLVHFCMLMFSGWGIAVNYLLANYFVLGLGFWMLSDKNNTTASLFFASFVAVTAIGDILLMIFFHYSESLNGNTKFSVFMTCMNLFLKPATFLYGFAEHKRRVGDGEGSGYTNFDTDVSPTYLPDHITPPVPGVDIGNPV